ncbi:MAG: 2-phosphosulfolactate phosphatase [Candidatus Azobacteroides sp.]|nr:2-phosphosulfolactate phosphatase [Candidatus Azobacteroides sp.]
MPTIDICLSPALYPAYSNPNAIIILVDIFRASSSICTAFANGAGSILPIDTIEKAQAYKKQGYPVAAERNALKCTFADFGNSPFEFSKDLVEGQHIVFTTTNFTKAIQNLSEYQALVVGCFLNLRAVTDFCQKEHKDILIVCAGWNNQVNIEDTLFGGAFISQIIKDEAYTIASDAAFIAKNLWETGEEQLPDYIGKAQHAIRLLKNKQEKDIFYCLQQNICNFVPQFKNGTFVRNKTENETQ